MLKELAKDVSATAPSEMLPDAAADTAGSRDMVSGGQTCDMGTTLMGMEDGASKPCRRRSNSASSLI